MDEPAGTGDLPADVDQPSVSVDVGLERPERVLESDGETAGSLRPSETFQLLANEVRIAVLLELLAAEREGNHPVPFSNLHETVGEGSSAGFAYHLRQLSGYFVRKTERGYALTPAGNRAANAIVSGEFTVDAMASTGTEPDGPTGGAS